MPTISNRVREAIERTKDATLIEVIDLDGSIRTVSPTYAELINLSSEELSPEEEQELRNWFVNWYY